MNLQVLKLVNTLPVQTIRSLVVCALEQNHNA